MTYKHKTTPQGALKSFFMAILYAKINRDILKGKKMQEKWAEYKEYKDTRFDEHKKRVRIRKIYVLIEDDPTFDESCPQVVGAFLSKKKCFSYVRTLPHSCNWYKVREFEQNTGKFIQEYEPYDGNIVVGSVK